MLPRLLKVSLLVIAIGALSAGAAQAAVTSSAITSPANGAYLDSNDDASATLTVTGTSNGTTGDHVRIRCWYDDNEYRTFDPSAVAVNSDGTFSATQPLENIGDRTCRLRAEPTTAGSEQAAFAGPRIAVSQYGTTAYGSSDVTQNGPNNGTLFDYFADGNTFASSVGWDSAGSCGPYARSLDPAYASSGYILDCVGSLFSADGISRSEIQVDTKNAYDPQGASNLFDRTGPCTSTMAPFDPGCDGSQDNAGFPALSVSQNWNAANGFESTSETDPIVACSGADTYQPASQADCPSFVSSGVTLSRAISMIGTNQILMTDTWTSTDGNAHNVSALYDDESHCCNPGFQFPGESGFSRHTTGDVIAGPSSAPGSVLLHSDVAYPDNAPDEGYGAVTFGSAPMGFVFNASYEFTENQSFSVPAGGSAKFSYIYSFGTSLEQVQALALSAQDLLHSPAVSITSPGNGAKYQNKTKTKKITVSGTATAGSGIKSLTVAGHAVSVGSNGAWSTTVTLKRGTQTITATALDNAGLTASAHITVIYAKACVIPHVKGQSRSGAEKTIRAAGCQVGKIKKVKSKIKKGHAVKTNHKAGKKLKPGAKIKLYVSEGR